jgi:HEAT repeat protein
VAAGWRVCGLAILAAAFTAVSGCSLAPKSFKGIKKPEPIVRARAIPMGRNLPDQKVMPKLISSLDDRDQVVRMAASEELKKRSGQDFGFVPYADQKERSTAVSRWQAWWQAQQVKLPKMGRRQVRLARTTTDP